MHMLFSFFSDTIEWEKKRKQPGISMETVRVLEVNSYKFSYLLRSNDIFIAKLFKAEVEEFIFEGKMRLDRKSEPYTVSISASSSEAS